MTFLPETVLEQLQESVAAEETGELPPRLRDGLADFLRVLQRRRGKLLAEEIDHNWTERFEANQTRIELTKAYLKGMA